MPCLLGGLFRDVEMVIRGSLAVVYMIKVITHF